MNMNIATISGNRPTQAHYELRREVIFSMPEPGAQLIADSEARATAAIRAEVEIRKEDNRAMGHWIAGKMLDPEWDSFKKSLEVINHWEARAERAEADLAAEREKCDKLLSVLVYADQILDDIDTCSDAHKPMYSTYSQNVFKLCIKGRDARRAAIDAAMKEGAK